MSIGKKHLRDMYVDMRRIRTFENVAGRMFAEGKIPGFVHLYLGEEAIAPAVCQWLRDDDYIITTHRGHGHMIAKGLDMKPMLAEICGKVTGYCRGKGGCMHIAAPDKGLVGANGIVGGGIPIANGVGLSCQLRGTDQVCVCFFGDGASNQGTFHEALNMAAIWKLPVIFVCENNFYAVSMSQARHQAIKDIADRGAAYNMPGVVVDGNNPIDVFEAAGEAIARARQGMGPTLLECKTYRQHGHYEGDPCNYRPEEEQAAWMEKDPLPRYSAYLLENGILTEDEIKEIDAQAEREVAEAVAYAEAQPLPTVETAVEDVYTDIVEEVRVR